MGLSANQLLALVVVGMAVLILVTAEWMFRINRRKSVFSLVLGILYLLAAGYYAFLAFASGSSPSPVDAGPMACAPARAPAGQQTAGDSAPFSLVLDVRGQKMTALPDTTVVVRKNTPFTIKEIRTPQGPATDLKANFVGFEGDPRRKDGQDIGYPIAYGKVDRKYALDPAGNQYRVEIKRGRDKIGSVLISFVD